MEIHAACRPGIHRATNQTHMVKRPSATSAALFRRWVAGLLILLLSIHAFAATASDALTLTPEESAWRAAHPVVEVGVPVTPSPPYASWIGDHPEGMAVDYLQLLMSRAGLRIRYRLLTNAALATRRGSSAEDTYDMLLAAPGVVGGDYGIEPLRPFVADYLTPLVRVDDARFHGADQPNHMRLAMNHPPQKIQDEIKKRYPDATILIVDEADEGMRKVAQGDADAFVTPTEKRATDLLGATQYPLRIAGPLDLPPYITLAPAVKKDLPMLIQILRKAEANIDPKELSALRQHWGLDDALAPLPNSSPATDTYAIRPTRIRVGYEVNNFPISFVNHLGQFDGIAADYVALLRNQLNLQIEAVPASGWDDIQRMVKAHQIDMIIDGERGDFAEGEVQFSDPYETFPLVIATRLQAPPAAGPDDLANKVVAVPEQQALIEQITFGVPTRKLVPVASVDDGLEKVAQGQADAFIGPLVTVNHTIQRHYPGELRVVGSMHMQRGLSIGLRADHADLMPAIVRVLSNVSERDRQAIRNRWISEHYEFGVPWIWVIGGLAAALGIIGLIVAINTRLRTAARAQAAAETRLAGQLDLQQAILETLPFPVFVKDSQGRYQAINRAYEEVFHCSREHLLGHTIRTTRHVRGIDPDEQHRHELALLAAGEQRRVETVVAPQADGDITRQAIAWLHPFFSEALGETKLLGSMVDVTDIREAEARARASEERLSNVTQSMPSTVYQVRAWPDGSFKMTYVAGNIEKLFGVSAEFLMANESIMFDRMHPDDRAQSAARLRLAVEQLQAPPGFEFRMKVHGQWRWLRTEGGQPQRLADGSVTWSGYWIDTSEIHAKEDALTEARALAEAAASAKSTFLATMSHEIRTPMSGVLGLIELLGRTPLNHDQSAMLDTAEDSARSLLQILDDILDYSRIDANRLSIDSAPFDLSQLVDNVAGLFSAKAADKRLQLYAIQEAAMAHLYNGDAVRIRQIITNLMSNALKFTEHGHVALRVELLDESEDMQRVRLTVEDTGIGISPDDLSRLFQAFSQAEDATSRRGSGTGLGLAISRRLAELMGGALHLESVPGEGTRAILELPLPIYEAGRPRTEFTGKRAWVGCIDAMLREEIAHALAMLGMQVESGGMPVARDDDLPDADVFVLDASVAAHLSLPTRAALVLVAAQGKQPDTSHPSLICHPLRQRALIDALNAAFGMTRAHSVATYGATQAHDGLRILVAEDHLVNRSVMERQLRALGYTCTLVVDGEQALAALAKEHYDVLICDFHMPVLDGVAVAKHIRAHEAPTQHLPIICLSASVLPDQVRCCMDAGMDDFLAKPVRLGDLASKLAQFSPTGASASSPHDDDWLSQTSAHLLDVYKDPEDLKQVLQALLDACQRDMRELESLAPGADDARALSFLHRMEGAMGLAGSMAPSASTMPLWEQHADQRRRTLHSQIGQLIELQERLMSTHP